MKIRSCPIRGRDRDRDRDTKAPLVKIGRDVTMRLLERERQSFFRIPASDRNEAIVYRGNAAAEKPNQDVCRILLEADLIN